MGPRNIFGGDTRAATCGQDIVGVRTYVVHRLRCLDLLEVHTWNTHETFGTVV